MREGQGMDFSKPLPEFEAIRNDLNTYREAHREDSSVHMDKIRTDMVKIIQQHLPTLSFEDAMNGLRASVDSADAFESDSIQKDMIWASMTNLVNDLERTARTNVNPELN